MTSIWLLALLSSGSNAAAHSTSKSTPRSNTSLLKAADEFVSAVRARDVSALLHFVPPNGIACIDSAVTRRDLEKQLRTPDTFLGDIQTEIRESHVPRIVRRVPRDES